MANLCIRQCFPRQNPKPTDSPKFCAMVVIVILMPNIDVKQVMLDALPVYPLTYSLMVDQQ